MADDFSRRLFEAAGSTLERNKSSGRKYFEARDKATEGLSRQQKAACEANNPTTKNFLGEKIFEANSESKNQARAAAYVQFPELFEVDKAIDAESRASGEPGNPFFDLSYDQALMVAQQKALPPGASDAGLNQLYEQSWYEQFKDKESAYYDQIFADREPDPNNPYQIETPEQKAAIDDYYDIESGYGKSRSLASIPGLAKLLFDRKEYQNRQRAELGLPPLPNNYAKYLQGGQESASLGATRGSSGSFSLRRGSSRRRSSGSRTSRRGSTAQAKLKVRAPKSLGTTKTSIKKIAPRKVKVSGSPKSFEPKFTKQGKIKIKYSKA
jgi:hypothetical protein